MRENQLQRERVATRRCCRALSPGALRIELALAELLARCIQVAVL
jgi:hypothetical protein